MKDGLRPTRYTELAYRKDDKNLWRIYDVTNSERPAATGPHYRTKSELLADLERYATEFGCHTLSKTATDKLASLPKRWIDSPFAKQWQAAKERHPGMIMLYRIGDFYECYQEDAETVASVCHLSILLRSDNVKMLGFPFGAAERYLTKLLQAGHRVAICEQVKNEDVPANATVNRVVTEGGLTE